MAEMIKIGKHEYEEVDSCEGVGVCRDPEDGQFAAFAYNPPRLLGHGEILPGRWFDTYEEALADAEQWSVIGEDTSQARRAFALLFVDENGEDR